MVLMALPVILKQADQDNVEAHMHWKKSPGLLWQK